MPTEQDYIILRISRRARILRASLLRPSLQHQSFPGSQKARTALKKTTLNRFFALQHSYHTNIHQSQIHNYTTLQMAVEAVAAGVIQKVTDLLIQEPVIFDKVIDEVEDIRIELRKMRGFFMDAEVRQHSDESDQCVKEWIQNYLETLYQVEDMVESYVLKLTRKKIRRIGLIKYYGFYLHDIRARQEFCRNMKDISEKIKRLKIKKPENIKDASLRGNSLKLEENLLSPGDTTLTSQPNQTPNSSDEEDDSSLVGYKNEEKELEDILAGEGYKIIKVLGELGSGKTNLVKRLYERKSIKKQFKCHAWVNVSEEHVLKDLLLKVWHELDNNRDSDLTVCDEEGLKDKLKEFLNTHKCLIVLDDAREQPDAWTKLIKVFPTVDSSKVVLTAREETAELCEGDSQTVRLEGLDVSNSRRLVLKILRMNIDGFLQENNSIWNKILLKCKGSPLNIELLGGLLSTKKMDCEEWAHLLSSHSDWHNLWLLSYNDLPANYKLCLLYLALFPKEFDVSARRILRLWLAEGFLRHLPGSPGLSEDLAEECFDYLVKRNLIKISKFRSDGGPKKCRLPGFLHEELSPKAQEIRLFDIHGKSGAVSNTQNKASGIRRVVEYADIKDYASGSTSKSTEFENLRSYLSLKFSRYDAPTTEVGRFLCKIIGKKGFGLLRVLDLEGVYKPTLPASLKHLYQLRYLGLRSTFLDTLPESVGNLLYLETLDLKRTYINTIPSSVWKLEHLRHLNLPQIRLDMGDQQLRSHLLTLWGLVIDDACNGLDQLVDLRELGITCQLEQCDELMTWIVKLTRLQSLSLISTDGRGRPSKLTLEPLQDLTKLSHLKLLGKLSSLLTKDQDPLFPPNIKVLTLSLSELKEDPMFVLSQLPCLTVLRLLAKSYVGQKMDCKQNGFKSLRVLKLWMLESLEEWTVQPGGMPNIRELNIRCCHKLKEVPLEILHRTTLEELVLTTHNHHPCMPEECMPELEKHVTENKSSRTTITVNRYNFSPLPWEKDADLWD